MTLKIFAKTASIAALAIVGLTGCGTSVTTNRTTNTNTTQTAKADVHSHSPKAIAVKSSSKALKDPNWMQDPINYEVTKKPVINPNISVPILMYHEAKYTKGNIITLKPGQFLSEIKWLHDNGFHTINFGQLYAAMYYGYQLPSRPILLSFDDGYESWYLDAYPILKEYHDQATGFVISSFMNKSKPNRKAKYPKLTIPEIQTLQKSGVFDIESHTVSHLKLATVSAATADYQLKESAIQISKMTGHPTLFFCYPDGSYNPTDVGLVRKNGYLLATTMRQGYANISQGPLTLDRIGIYSYTTLSDFAKLLAPSMVLHYGSQGPAVVSLQKRLNQLGYAAGIANGEFGKQTQRAVEAFQRAHHMTPDGTVGTQTRSAMGL